MSSFELLATRVNKYMAHAQSSSAFLFYVPDIVSARSSFPLGQRGTLPHDSGKEDASRWADTPQAMRGGLFRGYNLNQFRLASVDHRDGFGGMSQRWVVSRKPLRPYCCPLHPLCVEERLGREGDKCRQRSPSHITLVARQKDYRGTQASPGILCVRSFLLLAPTAL